MKNKISLTQKLAMVSDHWAPRTVATLNDYDIMIVKLLRQYAWHTHADTTNFSLFYRVNLK